MSAETPWQQHLFINRVFLATHEAGHRVLQVRFGFELGEISIRRDVNFLVWPREPGAIKVPVRRETLGMAPASPKALASHPERSILVALAGYGALIASGRPQAEAEWGADSDFAFAAGILDLAMLGELGEWKRRAVELMNEPANRAATKMLSDWLLRCGELSGELSKILVDYADGAATRADVFLTYEKEQSHEN